ncbi:hypothetical protein NKH18_50130 [Streptomyces sp. M10(2022)]
MTESLGADDRAVFEGVVRAALETPEIRRALRNPGVRVDAPSLSSGPWPRPKSSHLWPQRSAAPTIDCELPPDPR